MIDFHFLYFFIYNGDKKVMACNNNRILVKNYNQDVFSNFELLDESFDTNDTVKLLLLKLKEYSHTKFKGNNSTHIFPRYLFDDNLNYIDNKKEIKEKLIFKMRKLMN